MIDLVDQAEAKGLLAPYVAIIRKAMDEGWNRWEELGNGASHLKHPLLARTRANFISDHIAHFIDQRFRGDKHALVTKDRGFLLLNIRGKLLIRFKKLDKNGRSRNILTKQQRLFAFQRPLPGLEDETRLTAGYRLDELQIGIQDVLITCPVGKEMRWMYTIEAPAAMVMPLPALQPSAKSPKVRVRARDIGDRKKA